MEPNDKLSKLEISEFVNTPIKPEPRQEKTTIVNAQPGWYTKTVGKAVGTAVDKAKSVRRRISFRQKDGEAKDESKTYKDLLIKTAVCACIALALLLVKNINSPFTNNLSKEIKTAINSQTDLEKEIGRLKFVENIFGSEPVLSDLSNASDVYPVEGKVTQKFGEKGSKGVTIETALSSPVLSATEGKVKAAGKADDGTPFLTVTVDEKTEIQYLGVIARVKEKAKVKKGEILGTLKGNTLTVQVQQDGKAVDPLTFIGQGGTHKE